MADYIQITFADTQPEQQEVLIAHLSEAGYEGFEENGMELKAFIPEKNYDSFVLKELAYKYQLSFSEEKIASQNWNEVWESNFHPVIIDDVVYETPWVAIRADFHQPIAGVQHEIVITPKMSFGTGHHATTYMMIRQMRNIDFAGKSVLDFGTGTGVLAILAEKLGASKVIAVDNDDWSIENAEENIQRNNCSLVEIQKAGSARLPLQFDIILANINKDVILDNLPAMLQQLKPAGVLLLSGLLKEDEKDILRKTTGMGLALRLKEERANWLSLKFSV